MILVSSIGDKDWSNALTIHATALPWEESTNHVPRKQVVLPPVYILQFRDPVLVRWLGTLSWKTEKWLLYLLHVLYWEFWYWLAAQIEGMWRVVSFNCELRCCSVRKVLLRCYRVAVECVLLGCRSVECLSSLYVKAECWLFMVNAWHKGINRYKHHLKAIVRVAVGHYTCWSWNCQKGGLEIWIKGHSLASWTTHTT